MYQPDNAGDDGLVRSYMAVRASIGDYYHTPTLAAALEALRPALVLEAVAIFACGVSWFVELAR